MIKKQNITTCWYCIEIAMTIRYLHVHHWITDNTQEVLVRGVITRKEKPRNFKDIFSTFFNVPSMHLFLYDHKLR